MTNLTIRIARTAMPLKMAIYAIVTSMPSTPYLLLTSLAISRSNMPLAKPSHESCLIRKK